MIYISYKDGEKPMKKQLEKELLPDVKIEDLPEEMQTVADLIGIENVLKLSHYVDGGKMYVPIHDTILRGARDRKIIKEYREKINCKKISQKWNITEEQVRNILRDNGEIITGRRVKSV